MLRNVGFLCFMVLLGNMLVAQRNDSIPVLDSEYLEDQFYVGISYNIILQAPEGVTQSNFSYGLRTGFIKDIPLNGPRTFGLGIGLGYGVNSYYNNLRALETSEGISYQVVTEDFRRNKLETHLIEVPFQFRWRNSNMTEYKFWRVYGGFTFGYIVGSRSKFISGDATNNFKDSFYNTDTANFRYGLSLDLGYNTFNIHAYYGLNSLFDKETVLPDGSSIKFVPLRVGIVFYIL